MEQVQQKRGLRITAAIMFILICVLQIISNIRYMADNTWLFSGSEAVKNVISQIAGDLIYSIAIFAMIAAGLFAKKKSNGLRFAFGGLFAALLAAEIICMIGEISFEEALRFYWPEFVVLIAAAAVLFAVKRISLTGVGFSMLAWIRLCSIISSLIKYGRLGSWENVMINMSILLAFAFAAVVCFLNDSEKCCSAAKPFGILAIVFAGLWYVITDIITAIQISDLRDIEDILEMLSSSFSSLLLFLGILFAMIAIAFRKNAAPAKAIAYQPYQTYGQQPYRPVQPQYGQPYQAYGQQPYQPAQPQYGQPYQAYGQQPYQPMQPQYQPAQPQYQPAQPQHQPAQPQIEEPAPQQTAEATVLTCPACGTENPEGSRFCQICGTQLS